MTRLTQRYCVCLETLYKGSSRFDCTHPYSMHLPSHHHLAPPARDNTLLRRLSMAKHRPRVHQRQRQRQRRSATPTPIEQIKQTTADDTRRQHAKKQKAKEQQKKRHLAIAAATQRARRARWAAIAQETQGIVLGDGQYVEERPARIVEPPATHPPAGQGPPTTTVTVLHDIAAAVARSRQRTVFYRHYSPDLALWQDAHPSAPLPSTQIDFVDSSTLNAARSLALSRTGNPLEFTDVGVLSFASPKRPGGGYLNGSSEQEDTIARLSSLVASLSSPAGRGFYEEHKKFRNEDGSGLQASAIVYSPGVVVFRKDQDDEPSSKRGSHATSRDSVGGSFIPPYTVNVLSAVPVNAAAVRCKFDIQPEQQQFYEDGIRRSMKERMARALRAFEAHGDRVLVLGAFGCGSYENRVDVVARIWAELLVCGETVGDEKKEARFRHSFEKVVFAVPGKMHEPFKTAFGLRLDEEMLNVATLDTGSSC